MELDRAIEIVEFEIQRSKKIASLDEYELGKTHADIAAALETMLQEVTKERGEGVKLIIPGQLPGLNEYINALDKNRHAGAVLKKEAQEKAQWYIKAQLRKFHPVCPVYMKYTWYERNRRRDKDNVSSFGRKVIQDALVKTGVLENDGWAHIAGFSDEFHVDKKRPRVEVEIWEVETCSTP